MAPPVNQRCPPNRNCNRRSNRINEGNRHSALQIVQEVLIECTEDVERIATCDRTL